MQTFIQETIQDILKTTKSFENVTFILPSNRAGVFVKQALKEEHITGFLPEIINIEEFIQQVSGIRKLDSIQLLFYFYKIYKELEANPDSFDAFSSWAFTVLQDFNEIDQHLVDTREVFLYIRDVQRLKNWSVKGTFKETELIKNHFAFIERLNEYYDALYKFLLENSIGYQGCMYREATHKITSYLETNSEKKFFFIGFNALNKAEEYLFKEMLNYGNTEVYWDIDESFVYSNHQAGTFIRKYKTQWKYFQQCDLKIISNHFSQDKNIQLIGAAKNVSQMKYVGELLSEKDNYNKTALVLSDETLLPITLNSLPEKVSAINITMGYPLKDIPLTSLFLSLFQLFISQEKLQKKESKQFYYKDVIKVLKQPLIHRLLLVENNSISDEIATVIHNNNHTFISKEFLDSFLKKSGDSTHDLVGSLFTNSDDISTFLNKILLLIDRLKSSVESLEKEFLFRYFTVFTQLYNLQLEFGYFSDLKTLYQFFKQLIGSETISFQGEPLAGLQLMGMLETRLLDFETIILTSVNEGVLPANAKQTSFIPFDVKVEFGLPTYREKDAIFSYHFFRLIQRAKNIYLIYNTENDSFGGGEKSRFISQLELLKKDIQTTFITPKVEANIPVVKQVQKNKEVIDRLKELATKGISPSALTNYLYNPIAFYQKKVLKIKEFDEIEEEVAFNTLGIVVHETLRELYEPFLGKFIRQDDVKQMKPLVSTYVRNHFSIHFKNGDVSTGKNRLIFEVAKRFVSNFLNQEIDLLKDAANQLKIVAVEKDYEASINIDGIDFPIKIHGQVDRVDELNGVIRIIDYKTGSVKPSDLKVPFLEEICDFKYSKAIQVLLYAFMYLESESINENTEMQAGIISFKKLQSGFMKLNFAEKRGEDFNVTPERVYEFIDEIKNLIKEIYNPEVDFEEPSELPF
ncbi:PD-(D/E)XK nuclease family protein [Tenacibaculum sp. MEBiC06402]|uniref:PD-(D/E)XK nuclease family protein n=1 Tax=unclassified Tenacibaculum TaxID=2635139 RepID=UPI003B9A6BC0